MNIFREIQYLFYFLHNIKVFLGNTKVLPLRQCWLLSCVERFATHGLQPTRIPCPWDSPGKNTGVGCHFLLHGIFPTQGLDSGHLQCRWILYHLSHQQSPPIGISGNEYSLLLSSHNLLVFRNDKI